MVTEIDEELLLTTMRQNLLGGKKAIVKIRTIQKMYVKRLRHYYKPRYIEVNPAGISAQIKNYLTKNEFERIKKTPSGWIITRPHLKSLCKQYDIEIFPMGAV